MTFVKTVYGTARPEEFCASWANLETKEELAVGDLVAVDNATNKLIKATHEHKPVGVVVRSSVRGFGEAFEFTGERDKNKLKAGERVSLYKHFLVSGVEAEGIDEGHIGDTVYLGDSGLTLTKPSQGFIVGAVERVTDKLVRFNLELANIPLGE